MEFVKNFTPSDFQAKSFTPSISPNLNSFSGKKHKKMSEDGEIYTAGSDGMDKFHLCSCQYWNCLLADTDLNFLYKLPIFKE